MIRQTDVAVLCPIIPERLGSLRITLERLRTSIEAGNPVLFDQVSENHFARWAILEGATGLDGDQFQPQLLFSSNIDGERQDYFFGLLAADQPLIEEIYRCCEGFPVTRSKQNNSLQLLKSAPPSSYLNDIANIVAYWEYHRLPSAAFFVGSFGLTRAQIKREEALVNALQTFLDDQQQRGQLEGLTALQIRSLIQMMVRQSPELSWALAKEQGATLQEWVAYLGKAALILAGLLGAVFLFWAPLILLAVGWLLLLRCHEKADTEADIQSWQQHYDHISRIEVEEDHVLQNPMTSVTEIKLGLFRQLTLRSVFSVINFAAEYLLYDGKLGGINSIHFARWAIIDEGRRLLFLSNYDGSWERYLGDFIDRAADGLTAVWSNTRGFPKTRWLTKLGARNEQKFKAYARASQLPTQVWYTAYRKLSVTNILNNAAIRKGISGVMSEERAKRWLLRF